MPRPRSLRSMTFLLLSMIVLLQSISLASTLVFTNVINILKDEAYQLYNDNLSVQAATLNAQLDELMLNVGDSAQDLEAAVDRLSGGQGNPLARFQESQAVYTEGFSQITEFVLEMLQENSVTGAFVVLGTGNEPTAKHPAVYIRNTEPDRPTMNHTALLMMRGTAQLAQQHGITMAKDGTGWISGGTGGAYDADAFFTMPLSLAVHSLDADADYGYWSRPAAIFGDDQRVICYSLPLRDKNGDIYGVAGVEIAVDYFPERYLTGDGMAYKGSFYAVCEVTETEIDLSDWGIPSGPLAQWYLPVGERLWLESSGRGGLYSTRIKDMGAVSCAMRELSFYGADSPYGGTNWRLVGFVSTSVLHRTATDVTSAFVLSLGITTIISFVAVIFLTRLSTRKIGDMSTYLRTVGPDEALKFDATGLKEIDDLTGAIETLNKTVQNAARSMSKIMDLTKMPIGSYEINADADYVQATQYIYELTGMAAGYRITKSEWLAIYARLTRDAQEGYESVYLYRKSDGSQKWLRMLQAAEDGNIVGVIMDVSADVEKARRLEYELEYDALTGLYNRETFKRKTFHALREQPGKVGVLAFADLDNLKYINDNYGHDVGDRYIIKAGQFFARLSERGGIVSRISGDEFAMLLHGFDTRDEVRTILSELIENSIASLVTPDGNTHRVRFSVGLAWYPFDAVETADLLKLADYAMYEAKNTSKGSMLEFSHDSYIKNAFILDRRESINQLIDERLIRFMFQPIVDVTTCEVVAYEALMRSTLEGFNSPTEIIAVASAQSKLGQIEMLTLDMAFAYLKAHRARFEGKKLFINSLPSQRISHRNVRHLITNYRELFAMTVIEMTETESEEIDVMGDKIKLLRELGAKVAIDDFGAGHSNELRILSISPDLIKLDMGIIRNIHNEPDKQHLVANIISFCAPRGVDLIAEGVETREELAAVMRMGIKYVQGFYVGIPSYELEEVAEEKRARIAALWGEICGEDR